MADYTARALQILSYDTENTALDITDFVEGLSPIKVSAIDLVGYVKATATALLINSDKTFLETRFSNRWAVGNKIEIWVANSSGVLVLHRTLRILDAYYDEGRSPQSQRPGIPSLELELGDLFAYRDIRTAPPNDVKVPRTDPFEEVTIITQISAWLQAFDLPPITIAAGDETPTISTVTKVPYQGGGSVMEHIGRLLYLNSQFLLWVDAQERVRVRRVWQRVPGYDFNDPTKQIASYTTLKLSSFGITNSAEVSFVAERSRSYRSYDKADLEFEPVAASDIDFVLTDDEMTINERSRSERERVAGLIRITGTATYRDRYEDPDDFTITTNDGEFRTTSTESTDTSFLFKTQTIEKTGTVFIPGADPDVPFSNELGQFRETTVFEYGGALTSRSNPNPFLEDYPGLADHLLKKIVTIREQRRAADGTLDALAIVKIIETNYSYNYSSDYIQGVLIRGAEVSDVVTVTKIRNADDPAIIGDDVLVTKQIDVLRWREVREGIYRFTKTLIRPEDKENRRFVQIENSEGRSQPPATQWIPQQVVNKTRQIYAEFPLSSPPGQDDLANVRTYPVGAYLDSNRAAAILAKHLGAILVGRNETQNIAFLPTDDWIADPKPAPIAAVDDALYTVDVPVVVFEKKRCYVGGSGIYMGSWDSATETLTIPYAETPELWAFDADSLVVDETLSLISL